MLERALNPLIASTQLYIQSAVPSSLALWLYRQWEWGRAITRLSALRLKGMTHRLGWQPLCPSLVMPPSGFEPPAGLPECPMLSAGFFAALLAPIVHVLPQLASFLSKYGNGQ